MKYLYLHKLLDTRTHKVYRDVFWSDTLVKNPYKELRALKDTIEFYERFGISGSSAVFVMTDSDFYTDYNLSYVKAFRAFNVYGEENK